MKRIGSMGVGLAIAFAATGAGAQTSKRTVFVLPPVEIVGRVQKPIAAVDVARIEPKLTLTELKQSFLGRIDGSVSGL